MAQKEMITLFHEAGEARGFSLLSDGQAKR
jgi:hypothetical protein